LQRFESTTLKSRRCSDAPAFQSAPLTIVNIASPLPRK
jgi:hypothetical protein